MKRPLPRIHSVAESIPKPGKLYMTMSPGEWDLLLQSAYDRSTRPAQMAGMLRALRRRKDCPGCESLDPVGAKAADALSEKRPGNE